MFLPPIIFDETVKRRFINTCLAMLHARSEGETFGLACAEFAYCDRKVITYKHSPEVAHLEMLGDAKMEYDSPETLQFSLDHASRSGTLGSVYKSFTPEYVANKFIEILSKH